MAREVKRTESTVDFDIDTLSAEIERRFDEVPWRFFNSTDLASSGETRFMISRIQADLLKVAGVDAVRAGRIWDAHVPDFVPRPVELAKPGHEDAPENSIEPGRRRRNLQAEPFLEASEGSAGSNIGVARGQLRGRRLSNESAVSMEALGRGERDDDRIRLLLAGLEKQYLKADNRYHFRDRSADVAFEVKEKKLLTRHDAPAIVSSMIDLAETRGWSSLKLDGTHEFRREAWLQASLRDFEVDGYKPNKVDLTRLEELRQERAGGKTQSTMTDRAPAQRRSDWKANFKKLPEEGQGEQRVSLTEKQDQFVRALEASMRHRGDSPVAIKKARDIAIGKLTSERVLVGTLVGVGTAPYMDTRGEKLSHFVALRDKLGETTKVWGVDLPRALEVSGAQVGQKIAVVYRGQNPVEVDIKVKGEKGVPPRTERRTVERNTWEIVQFERLRDDAKVSVDRALERQEKPGGLKVFDRSAPLGQRLDRAASRTAGDLLRSR